MKQTIYELTENELNITALIEAIESGEGTDEATSILYDALIHNEADIEAKLEKYAMVVTNLNAKAAMCKAEADRILAKAKTASAAAERLKSVVKSVLEATGRQKMEAGTFTWGVQKNGGKTPLVVNESITLDPYHIDPQYLVTHYALNTDVVRAKLESGAVLSFASLGEVGSHVRLR